MTKPAELMPAGANAMEELEWCDAAMIFAVEHIWRKNANAPVFVGRFCLRGFVCGDEGIPD